MGDLSESLSSPCHPRADSLPRALTNAGASLRPHQERACGGTHPGSLLTAARKPALQGEVQASGGGGGVRLGFILGDRQLLGGSGGMTA